MYKYEKTKKINWQHAYLLFITAIAIVSLVGNAAQNRNYDETKKSYEREINILESTYQELQDKYSSVQNQLEIITDEYNELYKSGQ